MGRPYTYVTLISPGGVLTRAFADGTHALMRTCAGYLHSQDDGLLVEMAERREPVPWESAAVRDEAIRSIRARMDLEDGERADLIAWIEGTPYYE
ncbi:hypothetical protein ACOXXX_03575 [Thalassococcus sp. BH17M4-6]|uniref:hypothetical protein n=1 Tax=Thalassococcus sp. BH17M4-6 TaxID=3413148 RepID=UPI003BDBC702